MSKTLEEIASDTANRITIRPSGTNMTPVILDSLRAVERQTVERERERTCEWELDGHAVLQFFNTGCGVTRVTRHGKYCDNCGGLIVCKEKGEG